ncbi:hypothetical protein DL766_001792 [Monosporascus sp. MC13-8B]|uniref:Heterokaryon incompatibility domain-containing protein n=1 Tax=Monosporascus cannonballus TaxID=155416 RepID=A0ABY0HIQ7_9PEZI|nr:hypothetical protein DL762_001750 [Monosporascus cannonballus]RYP36914.1 hypothetical protein DL766_001792 [Monosporascus sp. MC13-8B]
MYRPLDSASGEIRLGGKDIIIDGERLGVFEDLEVALRRLRKPKEWRTLWIDAICINQDDFTEQQEQIPLMHKIYQQAQQVCILLGESTGTSGIAMRHINKIRYGPWREGLWRGLEADEFHHKYSWFGTREMLKVIRSKASVYGMSSLVEELVHGEIRELLARPWWNRGSAVQEAVVAKKPLIMCGQKQRCGSASAKPPNGCAAEVSPWRPLPCSASARRLDKPVPLFRLLYDFRNLSCADPRDGIYAFLGLTAETTDIKVQPDYTADIAAVYCVFAHQAIEKTRTHDVLNCKREWRESPNGVETEGTVLIYSVEHQSRYHDMQAMLIDNGTESGPRVGWARLLQEWEPLDEYSEDMVGMVKRKEYLFDHATRTRHEESPLKHQPPSLAEHKTQHRKAPAEGGLRWWDNLGRAQLTYRPGESAVTLSNETALEHDFSTLPSWASNWMASSPRDPELFLRHFDRGGIEGFCFTRWHEASVIADEAKGGDALMLEGMMFDDIEQMTLPWHPVDQAIPLSRDFQDFDIWEALAVAQQENCPYQHLQDDFHADWSSSSPETMAKKKALFEAFINRIEWYRADTPKFVSLGIAESVKLATYSSSLEEKMYAYYHMLLSALSPPTTEDDDATPGSLSEVSSLDDAISQITLMEPVLMEDATNFKFHTFVMEQWKDRWRMTKKQIQNQGSVYLQYEELCRRIHDICRDRALFVTKRSYMGLAPWNAKVGDRGALMRSDTSLVGEAYVYDEKKGLPLGRDLEADTWRGIRLV